LWKQFGIGEAISLLEIGEEEAVETLLTDVSSHRHRLIVRSNAPHEAGVASHGTFESIPAEATMRSLSHALQEILKQGTDTDPVFAIAQLAIEPALLGRMSNERRVSPRRNLWFVEAADSSFRRERISGTPVAAHVALLATNEEELLQCLRHVASFLETLPDLSFHCEWLWTGQQVWLVQADAADPSSEGLPTNLPANQYIQAKDSMPWRTPEQFTALKHFTSIEGSWRKLARPKLFRQLGLPSADVYVLSGVDWVNGGRKDNQELLADLARLCAQCLDHNAFRQFARHAQVTLGR
jgi:hypothetical protein